MSNNNEINITITSIEGRTETISLAESSTSLLDLAEFSIALLGIPTNRTVNLLKDGQIFYKKTPGVINNLSVKNLKDVGLKSGDLILVSFSNERTLPASTQNSPSGMKLDFSNLLNSASNNLVTPTQAPHQVPNNQSNGLTFNIPGLYSNENKTAVEWEGMNLDDAISRNPNPDVLMQILFNESKHPHLMKELNYHDPLLAKKLKEMGVDGAAKIWREEIMKGGINRAVQSSQAKSKDISMTERLRQNPMDEQANQYFGEKIREKNVLDQYSQMMETYPEAMGRVLMLYIETEVNSKPMQAFVDSGAQNTIMSASAAEKCGLLHLLDKRFEGTAVGVGTGKILGRIHIAPISVNGHFFPCSITVMDDAGKGLGDKNMEFLFGLDMLKRHRCKIDLERNVLTFRVEDGREMVTPFLHEKDLDENKGGTKGFDADQANIDLQQIIEKSMIDENKNNLKKD